ncbi:MAG: 30S ribosomal protein S6e [Candidatus Parvarchaeota archaeon]|nr:30S ribosomal protein S6e [Candidatus Parvarchaeota archaeon]MCW1301572.1 30S ribosomal protein S6e [Candidatus Parvarchaeota archaeon]
MEAKLVLNDPSTEKSYSRVISNEEIDNLLGLKIGDEFDMSFLGLDGYKGRVTGGSYMTGTPMDKSIDGTGLKRVLKVLNKHGLRKRKSVAGNTISQFTSQINVKIVSYGSKKLDEIFVKNNG